MPWNMLARRRYSGISINLGAVILKTSGLHICISKIVYIYRLKMVVLKFSALKRKCPLADDATDGDSGAGPL